MCIDEFTATHKFPCRQAHQDVRHNQPCEPHPRSRGVRTHTPIPAQITVNVPGIENKYGPQEATCSR